MRALFLVLLAAAGCDGSRFVMRDVPFCAGDDPVGDYAFAKTYVVITRADAKHYSLQTLHAMDSGPRPGELGVFNIERMFVVVVGCENIPQQLDASLAKELSEHVTPSVCPGQEIAFSGFIEAQPSPEATALGYTGFFHFPAVDLACRAGTLTQANDRTFAQHLARFAEAVEAYHARHEKKMPDSLDTLARDTMLAPLPVDPWGTALRFTTDGTTVFLHSAGADAAFDTADDIEVLRMTASSSSSIVTFPGVEHGAAQDYQALLASRGVASL